MKCRWFLATVLVLVLAGLLNAADGEAAGKQSVTETKLPNGVRVAIVYLPGSANVSIFSFLPLGLADDGPERTQWSHLLEHMIIRTTHAAASPHVNAETLPDHMRLDFYGAPGNWREGLSFHIDWLKGRDFAADCLDREKANILTESDNIASRLMTHKLAMAAWAQGYRHGLDTAGIKSDVAAASLADLQQYRDDRFAAFDRAVVCLVGDLDPVEDGDFVLEQLRSIAPFSSGGSAVQLHPGSRDMAWDIDAGHLLLTWPIPDSTAEDYPALMVAGHLLTQRLFADPQLKKNATMVLAGADLLTDEGAFFYVSASMPATGPFDEVREHILSTIRAMTSETAALSTTVPMFAGQLAQTIIEPADVAAVMAQAPPGVSRAMIEGNIALQWGMHVFRYGDNRLPMAEALRSLKGEDLRRTVTTHLSPDRCSVLTLRPGALSPAAVTASSTPAHAAVGPPPSGAWWTERQAGLVGGLAGGLMGCLCGTIGLLATRGKARGFVRGAVLVMIVSGAFCLMLGTAAVVLRQPHEVYYILFLGAFLLTTIPAVCWRRMRQQYEEAELRRMRAEDSS